jgi:hypothetical protein
MANGDLDDGTLALRLITDHIADCANARLETKGLIKEVRDLLLRFIAGVIGCVVIFAGWQYVQNQNLIQAQAEAAMAAQAAVHQTAAEASNETVFKLGVTPPKASQPGDQP